MGKYTYGEQRIDKHLFSKTGFPCQDQRWLQPRRSTSSLITARQAQMNLAAVIFQPGMGSTWHSNFNFYHFLYFWKWQQWHVMCISLTFVRFFVIFSDMWSIWGLLYLPFSLLPQASTQLHDRSPKALLFAALSGAAILTSSYTIQD